MTKKRKKQKLVEVARSFSYKMNSGNYETRDFFCSQKAECTPKDAEKTSEALYQFCKSEVIKSVNRYIAEQKAEKEKVANKIPAQKELAEKMKEAAEDDAGNYDD